MIRAYEKFSGKHFEEAGFAEFLKKKKAENGQVSVRKGTLNIGILGARANESIKEILRAKNVNVAFDLTCTGVARKILVEKDAVMTGYVRGLLGQFPCMRMEQAANRDELIRRYADSADGIIYHTVQFCDNYAYEYAWLKGWLKRPLLLLEDGLYQTELRTGIDQNRGVSGIPAGGEKAACQKEGGKRRDVCNGS